MPDELGGIPYHEAVQDGWLIRALLHCGLEAEILFQDDTDEGEGERLHRVVGQRGPGGWAVEVDYYVDTEERYIGTCHVEIIEGQLGVEAKLLQIRQVYMKSAAAEIALIMQKCGAMFPDGFGELRQTLLSSHPEVARDVFRQWDAIGLGERLETDTPAATRTPRPGQPGRL
jgi:hypothetical protein